MKLNRQPSSQAIIRQGDQGALLTDVLGGKVFQDLAYLAEFALLSANIYEPMESSPDCRAEGKRFEVDGWMQDETFQGESRRPWWAIIKATGFQYEIWIKEKPDGGLKAVIVFRGTDFSQLGDWLSNLRWLTRPIKKFVWDQYDQTMDIVPKIVDHLRSKFENKVEIISTGHSLGGGLAQQAAYISKHIKTVYAFDPSPVTGFHSVRKIDRDQNKIGVKIYRVYEHGEILAYLRLLMKGTYVFDQNPNRDPMIIEIRVNLSQGDVVKQHGMKTLACELYDQTP